MSNAESQHDGMTATDEPKTLPGWFVFIHLVFGSFFIVLTVIMIILSIWGVFYSVSVTNNGGEACYGWSQKDIKIVSSVITSEQLASGVTCPPGTWME